jgi:hypothetical protein
MLPTHDEGIFLYIHHKLCTCLLLLISLAVLSGFVEWRRLSILGKKRVNDGILLLLLLFDVMSSILSVLLGSHTRGTVSHAQLSIVSINYSVAFRHNRLAARYLSTCDANTRLSKVCGKKQKFNRFSHVRKTRVTTTNFNLLLQIISLLILCSKHLSCA